MRQTMLESIPVLGREADVRHFDMQVMGVQGSSSAPQSLSDSPEWPGAMGDVGRSG